MNFSGQTWKLKMNILFIAHNVNLHSRTGDSIHVSELSKNMAILGNKVSLIADHDPYSKEELGTIANDPMIELHYIKQPKIKYPRYKDISLLSLCLKLAKKSHFDVIYERNYSCKIGAALSKLIGVPLIVEINGVFEEEANLKDKSLISKKAIISDWLKNMYFRRAETIITVSPLIKDKLIEKYKLDGNKIEVVPNGANTELFIPMDKSVAQDKVGLSRNSRYICFVGNLTAWQGVDFLIKAAPTIIENNPDVRFLIVGDGVMRDELESMTKKNETAEYFLFIGSVPFKDVPLYINASDICIALFAANRKCSPLKVFEYLSCGRPVLLSDLGNDTELFKKCESVFYLQSQSPADIADMVNELFHKYSEGNSMMARDFILENYTWKNTATKVIDICRRKL